MNPQTLLEQAMDRLAESYGSNHDSVGNSRWETAVWVVIGADATEHKLRAFQGLIAETALHAPETTASAAIETLAEALHPLTKARQIPPLLKRLATWWIEKTPHGEAEPLFGGDRDVLREEIRRIPGMGPGLTDRVLLFAGDVPLLPRERSALRVAVRHGWVDADVDDEEWQAMPRGYITLHAGTVSEQILILQSFSRWLACVGKDHCGPTPKCENCPLESCLPPGGPIEPE